MSDDGRVWHFLGIKADCNDKEMFLSQSTYANEIIERAGMEDCKPIATAVDIKSKLSAEIGDLVANPTE